MQRFFKKNNKGFTLVETLVSISIFSISILGLLSVLASGISNTSYAKQKMVATYLAQEGIEYVRNVRDTSVLYDSSGAQHGWDTFKSTLPVSSSLSFYPTSSDFSGYVRTIRADTGLGSDEVKIFSTVTWSQGSGQQSVTFTENLFNWIE